MLYKNWIYYLNVISIKYIKIKKKNDKRPKAYTEIDINLRFELIRENVKKKDDIAFDSTKKNKLGNVIGIKFDRGASTCEIYGPETYII